MPYVRRSQHPLPPCRAAATAAPEVRPRRAPRGSARGQQGVHRAPQSRREGPRALGASREALPRPHLMREAIQYNQRQSAAIRGPREALPRPHLMKEAIQYNQRQSAAIRGPREAHPRPQQRRESSRSACAPGRRWPRHGSVQMPRADVRGRPRVRSRSAGRRAFACR